MYSTLHGVAIRAEIGARVYAPSAFARLVGFASVKGLLGKSWRQVYDQRDIALREEHVRESVLKTGRWSGQIALHRRDDGALPIEMTITLMPQGGTVCVARDVSERLQAEHARNEAEIKYRTLIEQVAAISYIAELGFNGQWLYVSPQIETMFGYSAEEWLSNSKDWIRHIPAEQHPILTSIWTRRIRAIMPSSFPT